MRRSLMLIPLTLALTLALAGCLSRSVQEPPPAVPEPTVDSEPQDDGEVPDPLAPPLPDGRQRFTPDEVAKIQADAFFGVTAPPFSGTDVLTGATVTLADLQGRPVFLNFWATWCAPCREEMPAMQRLHEEMGERAAIVAINADRFESPEQQAAFAAELGLTFHVVDDGGMAAGLYRLLALPTSYFIDGQGIIRARRIGLLEGTWMRAYIDYLEAGS